MLRTIALATLATFLPIATGCVSHEYQIPKDELRRLANTPPDERGTRVRVVQEIGGRRGRAVPPPSGPFLDEGEKLDLAFRVAADFSRVSAPRGGPPSGGGSWRGVQMPVSDGGGGGGGGDSGELLLVVAVIAVAVGAVVAIGLAGSEGARYDGLAEMSPYQPLYLKNRRGQERVVPLGALSTTDAEAAVEAKVMDDEGYGLRRLGHLPVDRRGSKTFKMDLGAVELARDASVGPSLTGLTANVQVGYFFRPWLGLLLSANFGGAEDDHGAILTRHVLGLEAQSLFLRWGALTAGVYGGMGIALTGTTGEDRPAQSGTAFGGGALAEIDLTGRMAFLLRAGSNGAYLPDTQTWSPAATLTAGIAIY